MKQFLLKLRDAAHYVFGVLMEFTRGLSAFLQNIDQPRGVILCVTLQLVVVISLVLMFRNPADNLAKPLDGKIQSLASPEVSESIEPERPLPLVPSPENQ